MADKSISELVAATAVGSTDLFVLEQTGTAKKLTGQILENWLVSFADGHGGIQSIVKTSTTGTNPVIDTYTITLADTTTSTFTVTNGIKGDTGASTYVWIKYASTGTPTDAQMSDVPDDYIGIYVGLSSPAPTTASSYTWFEWKGEQGDPGAPATIDATGTKVEYKQTDSGSVVPPDEGWTTTVPTAVQGKYLWTRTTVAFNTGNPVVSYSVSRYGVDGSGTEIISLTLNISNASTVSQIGAASDSRISANSRIVHYEVGNPLYQTSDWTVTTSDYSDETIENIVVTGTCSSATTLKLLLAEVE